MPANVERPAYTKAMGRATYAKATRSLLNRIPNGHRLLPVHYTGNAADRTPNGNRQLRGGHFCGLSHNLDVAFFVAIASRNVQ